MISAVTAPSAPAVIFSPRPKAEDKNAVTPPDEKNTLTQLSDAEKDQVKKLEKTDREVRAHEQAHKNAGGRYAGSASYGYQVGPDGKRYAVSGEVSIDIAPIEGDPEATISKMNVIISAALAPAKPSSQDRRVAAQAATQRNEAQAEAASGQEDEENGDTFSVRSVDFRLQAAQTAYNTAFSEEGFNGNIGQDLNLVS